MIGEESGNFLLDRAIFCPHLSSLKQPLDHERAIGCPISSKETVFPSFFAQHAATFCASRPAKPLMPSMFSSAP
jgi:hypothetical protein